MGKDHEGRDEKLGSATRPEGSSRKSELSLDTSQFTQYEWTLAKLRFDYTEQAGSQVSLTCWGKKVCLTQKGGRSMPFYFTSAVSCLSRKWLKMGGSSHERQGAQLTATCDQAVMAAGNNLSTEVEFDMDGGSGA